MPPCSPFPEALIPHHPQWDKGTPKGRAQAHINPRSQGSIHSRCSVKGLVCACANPQKKKNPKGHVKLKGMTSGETWGGPYLLSDTPLLLFPSLVRATIPSKIKNS